MFSRIAAAYALLDGVRRLLVNLLFLLTLVTLAVVFWARRRRTCPRERFFALTWSEK